MVLRKAASLVVRLSRTLLSHPFKPLLIPRTYPIQNAPQILSKTAPRFYLFPSIYRSFFNATHPTTAPFRLALHDIKRRFFFTAPNTSRFLLGLIGFSLASPSQSDRFPFEQTFHQIGNFFSKVTPSDDEEKRAHSQLSLDDYELGRMLGLGCNAAVYEARVRPSNEELLPPGQFNLAIKMLFNYSIQSNAAALRRAMDKELLPLNHSFSHPNLIPMYSSFVDSFPLLQEAYEHYPMAIPTSLVAEGFGRNQTLFLVMRKYDLTLKEYLQKNQLDTRQRLTLFAQLIEGLIYLKKQAIVHRDLKSDNLLICEETGELVLADFGCALSHPPDLKVPYQTDAVSKGGNWALMAPEISSCKPGPKSSLDYSKSDLWASGTLFYEFFSQSNPFYDGTLQQDTYDDQNLPSIPPIASSKLEQLAYAILRRDPSKRPSVNLIGDVLHLCLWFQSQTELYRTYMWTALETLFTKQPLNLVEHNLKTLFFQRQTSHTFSRARRFLEEL